MANFPFRILVTGAGGQVGSEVAAHLLEPLTPPLFDPGGGLSRDGAGMYIRTPPMASTILRNPSKPISA